MDPQQSLVAAYAGFVAALVTVEKRNIAALTEIARDALQTNPHAAPGLATVITNRVLQVRRRDGCCSADPAASQPAPR